MAFVTLGTVAPGDVLRANSGTAAYNNVIGNINALSRGLLKYTATTAQTTFSTTTADLLTRTWTAVEGENYLVMGVIGGILKQTNAGNFTVSITDGANVAKAKWIQSLAIDQSVGAAYVWEFIRNATAGSTTRKLRHLSGSAGGVFNRGDLGATDMTFLAVLALGNDAT